MRDPRHGRFAWARLNAYGVLLGFLALMGISDLINPGKAPLAAMIGEVPPGQYFWATGVVVSGGALLFGFLRRDRISETLGLAILTLSVALQTAVAWSILGATQFTGSRLFLLLVVAGCSWARASVLWTREGLIFTIPPRHERPGDER